jgi:fructose-bisphosphate aldolase class 1
VSTTDSGKTAQALVADGRGLLAADETVPAVTRRLAALMTGSTLASRRAYQEILFTTPGVSDFISVSSCGMRRSIRRTTRRYRPPIC